jgi:hypothetical protein
MQILLIRSSNCVLLVGHNRGSWQGEIQPGGRVGHVCPHPLCKTLCLSRIALPCKIAFFAKLLKNRFAFQESLCLAKLRSLQTKPA